MLEDHHELLKDRRSFVVCTAATVLLAILSTLRWLPSLGRALRQAFLSTLHELRHGGTGSCSPREALVQEEVRRRKALIASRLRWYAVCMLLFWSLSYCLFVYSNSDWDGTTMSPGQAWTGLAMVVVLLARTHAPSSLSCRNLDLDYAIIQVGTLCSLSPGINPTREGNGLQLLIHILVSLLFSMPASMIGSTKAVALGQLAIVFTTVLRLPTDPAEPRQSFFLILASVCFLPCALWVVNLTTMILTKQVDTKIQGENARAQLSAASALLELTCDAVVELDSDFQLLADSPQLATTLLLCPGACEKGRKFTDFVDRQEEQRVSQLFQHPDAARAFYTHLSDSCGSRFRAEVFQVKYTMDGEPCHLVGLRDLTDLGSLGRDRAFGRPAWLDLESPMSSKTSFMDVDMANERIQCASVPFASLAGRPLEQVFASEARQLLRRVHGDAVEVLRSEARVMDQVVTYSDMPLTVQGRIVRISGTMKVSVTGEGQFHIMMAFQGVAVGPTSL